METVRRPSGLEKFQPTDREECGLLIQESNSVRVVKVPNRSVDSENYEIWVTDVQAVEENLEADEKIIGFFHTHLSEHRCEPSDADFSGAEIVPGTQNLIYKPSTEELCWYGVETEVLTP